MGNDDAWTGQSSCRLQRFPKFLRCPGPESLAAHRSGVHRVVDPHAFAVGMPLTLCPMAESVARILVVRGGLTKHAGALKSTVLDDHEGQFQALRNCGPQFGGSRHVGSVADDHEDMVAVVPRECRAHAVGNLVSHAGNGEIQQADASAGIVPRLHDVGGRRAYGRNNDIPLCGHSVGRPYDHALIHDPEEVRAAELAARHGATVARGEDEIPVSVDISAVAVCPPADTHVDLVGQDAGAGKAALYEKPIDPDVERVFACFQTRKQDPVPFTFGFHRLFEPHHLALPDVIRSGAVGRTEQIRMVSQDPAPPPIE